MINQNFIKASLNYLNNGKRFYSCEDILIYRLSLGKAWTNRKKEKSFIKIVSGGLLCVIGLISLPIPTGSFFMIGVGCSLMVCGGLDLWAYYRRVERKAILLICRFGGVRFLK